MLPNRKNKLRFIIIILTALSLCAGNIFAQTNSYHNVTLKKALEIVESQYQIKFSYSTDIIDLNKSVSFNLRKSLEETLNDLGSSANFKWKKIKNSIILIPEEASSKTKFINISGTVREKTSMETIPEIIIESPTHNILATANNFGYYSISIPYSTDSILVQVRMLGYYISKKILLPDRNLKIDWEVESSVFLNDIEIKDARIEEKAFHKSLNADQVDKDVRNTTPRLFGEKDVLSATRYFAGVNRENDITNGYNIRGGRGNQNLIILDDAPLYYAFHLFGMYSIFNDEALKQMNFIKSGFPARYGGRLSSVVEMITKDGNQEEYHGEVGTGLISSKLTLEGPILKDRAAFFLSGRRSHINKLVEFSTTEDSVLGYGFYDLNAKLNFKISDKDRIFLSAYTGRDKFDTDGEIKGVGLNENQGWGNQTSTIRWNHIFHDKWFSNTSLIFTSYKAVNSFGDTSLTYKFQSGARDIILKYDLDYFHSDRHKFKSGLQFSIHKFQNLNNFSFSSSNEEPLSGFENNSYESEDWAFYLEDEITFSNRLSFNIGARFTGYKYKGDYGLNGEPRIMGTYLFAKKFALKASYGRMTQTVHNISSTIQVGVPSEFWIPSSHNFKPEISDQFAAGVFYNDKKYLKMGVEIYYKTQQRIVAYSSGSDIFSKTIGLLTNTTEDMELGLVSGQAKSYGAEYQIEYRRKLVNLLMSYNLSYSKEQFDELNEGLWYWANQDRRHSLSILGSVKFTKRLSMNTSWIYTTGNPFSLPDFKYSVVGHEPGFINNNFFGNFVNHYKGKNTYRMSDYHRLDVSINYEVAVKRGIFDFQVGAMNVYNRKNAIMYSYVSTGSDDIELKKFSLAGIFPTVSLNFKF